MFEVSDFELDFYRAIAPAFGGVQLEIAPPTLSPLERRRERLAFRNVRTLYRRKSDLSGKALISMYSPKSPHKVFHTDEWFSDAWDPMTFGRDYDFGRPFFEQFAELFLAVPLPHRFGISNDNSEYINGASFCRDCYLSFNLFYCESGLYISDATRCVDCTDCLIINRCELCYECVSCEHCYDLAFSERCQSSSESQFLFQCQSCRNCIGCTNLQNAENFILNQPASPEAVEALRQKLKSIKFRTQFAAKFQAIKQAASRRSYVGFRNEDFSGDHLYSVKNAHGCFQCSALEDSRYCVNVFNSDHCVDLDVYGDGSSWIYNSTATGNKCHNVLFGNGCWAGTHNTMYCTFVAGVGNCFGCSGIRNREYCILNKQYSKTEYYQLVPRIVQQMRSTGEWGEFFPASMSPFPYNETFAHELMPLSQQKALTLGYSWREIEVRSEKNMARLTVDTIEEFTDLMAGSHLACFHCDRPYQITSAELRFYRKQQIAPPKECSECRHARRRANLASYELHSRNCSRCKGSIQTAFKDSELFPVLCDECFFLEIAG